MSRQIMSRFAVLSALVVLAPLFGCSGQHEDSSNVGVAEAEETAAAVEAAAVLEFEATDEMLAVLEAADGFDGEADHVITQCPGCGLAMEGSADHALHVADYELHFCSDTCMETFEEHAEEALLALNIPADEE